MSVFESHRWLGYVLRLGVSASLIAWMLGRAELSRVGDVLRAADAMLIAVAFASYFVGYMVSVARWRVLLAVQGIRPRFSYLYWSFMIGVFFNQLLPTTIGGDVARYQYTAAGGRGAALSAVLLDRVFGTVSLMVVRDRGIGVGARQRDLAAGTAESRCGAAGRRGADAWVRIPAAGAALGLLRRGGAHTASWRAWAVRESTRCFRRFPRAVTT